MGLLTYGQFSFSFDEFPSRGYGRGKKRAIVPGGVVGLWVAGSDDGHVLDALGGSLSADHGTATDIAGPAATSVGAGLGHIDWVFIRQFAGGSGNFAESPHWSAK
jgi:hypothetical protein